MQPHDDARRYHSSPKAKSYVMQIVKSVTLQWWSQLAATGPRYRLGWQVQASFGPVKDVVGDPSMPIMTQAAILILPEQLARQICALGELQGRL